MQSCEREDMTGEIRWVDNEEDALRLAWESARPLLLDFFKEE